MKPVIPQICSLVLILSLSAGQIHSQVSSYRDSVLATIKADTSLDNSDFSAIYDSLFYEFASVGDSCGQIKARVLQSTKLDGLGKLDSAVSVLLWAENHFGPTCDSSIFVELYLNYTNVFLSLEDFGKVDSTGNYVLRIWRDSIDDPELLLAAMNNLAISAAYQGNIGASDSIFRRVFREARRENMSKYVQRALINLGTLKGMNGDLDSAYYFLNTAALEARETGDNTGLAELLINLSTIDLDRDNYASAQLLLDSAYVLASRKEDYDVLSNVLYNFSVLWSNQGRYQAAYDTLLTYTQVREEYLNEERLRAVADMQEKYESERKARVIQKLKIENLDSQMETVRFRSARNRTLFLGGFILLVAIGLWSRLRYVRRSRAAIQKERDISDGLLLNILPATVAEELKEKGKTEARFYETATIMFSDFKDFTQTASQVTAEELVSGINTYFKAFDEIITNNGVEKIKTIGDSYMAAGGIDEENPVKAADVVRVALDIRDFVEREKNQQHPASELYFDMRVGVHSGPVVAGIVGVKKFQYDLWGDTVNIASRMETNGVPGKVNISESTYELIKDDPSFVFESRGMLDVKGKGEMQMYFVERAVS